MSDPWTFPGRVSVLDRPGGIVTLVDESTFAISSQVGDMVATSAQGLFVRDTRILSRFELRVNATRPEVLAAVVDEPFSATFVSQVHPGPGRADSTLMVFRFRYVGQGMREDLLIRNFGPEPTFCSVELFVDTDFADLFAVKEGRAADPDGEITRSKSPDGLELSYRRGTVNRGTLIQFSPTPSSVGADLVSFEAIVPARGEWKACVEVHPVIEGKAIDPRYLCGQPVEKAAPAERLAKWRRQVPQVDTDNEGLRAVLARSAEDLGALRIFDPDFPERVVVAAGAPWFMTVFGRDSLLTSWMALLVDPDLALGVLQTLARFQGEDIDPRSEEQPGRILHEMRFGEAPSLSLGGGSIYYGTADATPLFVMLLGELRRWGLAREAVDELLPNAERALEWIERFGDADGDGYVEYHRATDRGLANQGWKDSWDAIRYADGRLAHTPIALCEVQAYVYSAYLARAHFAREGGDEATFDRYRAKALRLKEDFNRDFWLEEKGWYALGLDADKKPIDSLASNIGHCMWTGIIDEEKAPIVAAKLMSPEMFSGWGVRTLATSMGGFNPISYHCGSVWPHDTAIVAAGLARYGLMEDAQRVVSALLEAAVQLGGRLPELFSGLDRTELASPVGYPTSCSPQAWAAASPLLCLRTLLRLDPWVPYGMTWLAPALPEGIHRLKVERIPLAGSRVTVEVEGDHVEVTGLPPEVELVADPRHPATAV
ncbi:MAG TPA: glycogen debranching N-terminal domain-containing protein [Acidimicrobiales bacterium]|nr:glycogen debranching N-terminal domain-containing protein [Acidimicrobiales bacterium]